MNLLILFVCPRPQFVMLHHLQRTCHYMVNHYEKIRQVRLWDAINIRTQRWGGTNGKDSNFLKLFCW